MVAQSDTPDNSKRARRCVPSAFFPVHQVFSIEFESVERFLAAQEPTLRYHGLESLVTSDNTGYLL